MDGLMWASIALAGIASPGLVDAAMDIVLNGSSKAEPETAPEKLTEIKPARVKEIPEYFEDVSYFFKDDCDPVLKAYYEPQYYSSSNSL